MFGTHRGGAATLVAAVVCALALASCSTSSSNGVAQLTTTTHGGAVTTSPASTPVSQALDFARCMRSHGVPNWPGPVLMQGRLIFDPQSAGIDPNAPKMVAKIQACDYVFPASVGVPPGAGHNPS